jgi:hypothetical protein
MLLILAISFFLSKKSSDLVEHCHACQMGTVNGFLPVCPAQVVSINTSTNAHIWSTLCSVKAFRKWFVRTKSREVLPAQPVDATPYDQPI